MTDTVNGFGGMTQKLDPVDRIIFRRDLCKMLGVGSECMRRYIKAGKVPPPDIFISQQTMGWRLSTLQASGIGVI